MCVQDLQTFEIEFEFELIQKSYKQAFSCKLLFEISNLSSNTRHLLQQTNWDFETETHITTKKVILCVQPLLSVSIVVF